MCVRVGGVDGHVRRALTRSRRAREWSWEGGLGGVLLWRRGARCKARMGWSTRRWRSRALAFIALLVVGWRDAVEVRLGAVALVYRTLGS